MANKWRFCTRHSRPRTANVEAIEAMRSLIDRIVLTPTAGKLTIDLYGEIAAILRMAAGKKGCRCSRFGR